MSKKQKPKDRKAAILDGAIEHAKRIGYYKVTREHVAIAAGCSVALVSHYWGTMPQLRRAIMRQAIARRELTIILQGIAANDPQALKAPRDLQQAAIQQISGA